MYIFIADKCVFIAHTYHLSFTISHGNSSENDQNVCPLGVSTGVEQIILQGVLLVAPTSFARTLPLALCIEAAVVIPVTRAYSPSDSASPTPLSDVDQEDWHTSAGECGSS